MEYTREGKKMFDIVCKTERGSVHASQNLVIKSNSKRLGTLLLHASRAKIAVGVMNSLAQLMTISG